MGREIHQSDWFSLPVRHSGARRSVFAQRIVEFHHPLVEQLHQHLAGHQFAEGGDTDHRVELRVLIIPRAGFAKAAKNTLIAIDNHQRHAGGAAAVVDMIGVTIDHIRGENRVNGRLCGLHRGPRRRAQRSKNEQTTFQRRSSIK